MNTSSLTLGHVAAGLVGGLLGGVFVLLLGGRDAVPSQVITPGTAGELGLLHRDLAELIAVVRERPIGVPPVQDQASGERIAVGGELEGLVPALASLEEALKQAQKSGQLAGTRGQVETAPLHWGAGVPRNLAAMEVAADQVARDEESGRGEYFGLSMRQIYNRFGLPDEAYIGQSGLTVWNYENEVHTKRLVFNFADGIVLTLWGRAD